MDHGEIIQRRKQGDIGYTAQQTPDRFLDIGVEMHRVYQMDLLGAVVFRQVPQGVLRSVPRRTADFHHTEHVSSSLAPQAG